MPLFAAVINGSIIFAEKTALDKDLPFSLELFFRYDRHSTPIFHE